MLGAAVDLLIIALLVTALCFGGVLHRRLVRWQQDSDELRALVESFDRAAERAETALGELRRTAEEAAGRLGQEIREARRLEDDLRLLGKRGEALADRLMGEVERARAAGGSPGSARSPRPAPRPRPAAGEAEAERDPPVSPDELERALRALR